MKHLLGKGYDLNEQQEEVLVQRQKLQQDIIFTSEKAKAIEQRMQHLKDNLKTDNFVKLFCDYSARPVWNREGGNMEYDELPVSEALKIALRAWELHYDFNDNKNYSGRFSCSGEMRAHDRVGREIALEVKRQLPHWTVVYVPNTHCGEPYEVKDE